MKKKGGGCRANNRRGKKSPKGQEGPIEKLFLGNVLTVDRIE